jgi:Putative zinc-finger
MTHIKLSEQPCQKFRAKLDSYIDNELLTETNIELMEHFERCPECRQEAQERRNMRDRLRKVVRKAPVPSDLEKQIRLRLRHSQQTPPRKMYFMAVAAVLVVCFSIFGFRENGSALLRLAFDDHLHCAVIHHPRAQSAADINRLPAPWKDLAPLVRQSVPAELPLILAHECQDNGRKFIHLTFGDGESLLSVIVTRRTDGEILSRGVHQGSRYRFEAAAFETGDYLVYTVSDLPRVQNARILTALAPAVQTFLAQRRA